MIIDRRWTKLLENDIAPKKTGHVYGHGHVYVGRSDFEITP